MCLNLLILGITFTQNLCFVKYIIDFRGLSLTRSMVCNEISVDGQIVWSGSFISSQRILTSRYCSICLYTYCVFPSSSTNPARLDLWSICNVWYLVTNKRSLWESIVDLIGETTNIIEVMLFSARPQLQLRFVKSYSTDILKYILLLYHWPKPKSVYTQPNK